VSRAKITGVYGITMSSPGILRQAECALAGGVRVLQYREKTLPFEQRVEQAMSLRSMCHQYSALFLINDDVELALAVEADGVHLGHSDGSYTVARRRLGDRIMGISCYNSLERAVEAQANGADYVAFGRFFPSQTKPEAVQADIGLIRRAKSVLKIPVVAIGGITPKNAATLINEGVDAVAAIHGLFGFGDAEENARAYTAVFSSPVMVQDSKLAL